MILFYRVTFFSPTAKLRDYDEIISFPFQGQNGEGEVERNGVSAFDTRASSVKKNVEINNEFLRFEMCFENFAWTQKYVTLLVEGGLRKCNQMSHGEGGPTEVSRDIIFLLACFMEKNLSLKYFNSTDKMILFGNFSNKSKNYLF